MSSSLPSGKRATKSTSDDYEKEKELIRQENAELVTLGAMTQEEADEAEELLGTKEQPAKKKKLGSSASDVTTHFGELKAMEKVHFENKNSFCISVILFLISRKEWKLLKKHRERETSEQLKETHLSGKVKGKKLLLVTQWLKF